jgi:AcrR family transcriptional regulator
MVNNDKRATILSATINRIAVHGFHRTPIEHIAEQAGVSKGTIYCYFKNKDDLITQVYRCLEKRVLRVLATHYPENAPVRERFMHAAEVLVRYLIGAPTECRFLEQFHNSPYGVAYRREWLFAGGDGNVITKLFQEAREAGVIKELPNSLLFALAFGPLLNICHDQTFDLIELDDLTLSRAVEACWDAIALQ